MSLKARKQVKNIHIGARSAKTRLKDPHTWKQKRRERGDLIQTYRIMNNIDKINPETFFQRARYTSTRGHNQKFDKSRSRLDVRKFFFSQRVVEPWNKLPESAINAPTLLCFKKELSTLGF